MAGRAQQAVERFVNGYNCSQAILSTYGDLYGIDEVTAFKLAEGFGLGMGGFKDECGALTSTFMTLGLANSDGDLGKGTTKLDTYAKVKEAGKAFEESLGSMMCGELLRKEKEMKAEATAEQLEESKGKNLICIACVKWAAEYLDKELGLAE